MTILKSLTHIPQGWKPIRILTANVGNLSFRCRGVYNHKLCQKKVEETVSKNIQVLRPDIVFLQELMHPLQCSDWLERDPKKLCFSSNILLDPNQARRLLGKNYTILCASRMRSEIGHPVGMECIGVHTDTGTIDGCQLGGLSYSLDGMDTPGHGCNPEFVIMSAIAKVRTLSIRLINAHPHSRNRYCRDSSLKQIFEGMQRVPMLKSENNIIIAGDFNFDPFNSLGNTPEIWQKYVGLFGSGKPFYYHSGVAERNPPYPTAYFLFQKKTIDHIISNFAAGICNTLGESPGTHPIDGGKGIDHRAILCDMWIPPQ